MARTYGVGIMGAGNISSAYLRLAPLFKGLEVRGVADIVPDCTVTFATGATADIRDYRVDFSKIERELPGYQPQWTVRKGVEQLYEAYVEHELTMEDFLGPRYQRLKKVGELLAEGRIGNDLRWAQPSLAGVGG